ncbi:MAG: formate--tetrahydrofolate ligase [Vampirovibrionia bacterium]
MTMDNNFVLSPIQEIAEKAGIELSDLELYGKYKAKVDLSVTEKNSKNTKGKLVFVTCITPTPAGEGKTLTSIGLAQAFGKLNKNIMLCLREPSLGPVFGTKGGATGAGRAQIMPMEDINLHFTGDLHAISSAHNLMSAIIDNHIFRGNALGFDVNRAHWRRVLDMNDRALRDIMPISEGGLYGKTGFDITASSEIMAIMALTSGIKDLKKRLSRIIVGYGLKDRPIRAEELEIIGSQATLLKDAIKPNLVQTIEGQPVFIHCGPFANIAHGNSSVIATKMALNLADYVITEGGFASDLGAEKFFDIVCPSAGIKPDVAVLVCSIKALNLQGGAPKKEYSNVNLDYLDKGLEHLKAHINILKNFNIPIVVAINKFDRDTEEEIALVKAYCKHLGVRVALSDVYANGGEGGVDLASEIITAIETDKNEFKPLYDANISIVDKIEALAKNIYGASGVEYSTCALKDIDDLTYSGFGCLPICMAKTQFSLSDDSKLKGVPKDWVLNIRQLKVSSGAGFIVAISGNIMLMPGLAKIPAANAIKLTDDGVITGLR